jgi:hypothetical protein
MKEILNSPSIIIKILVLITLLHALFNLKRKKPINKLLVFILTLSFFTEAINTFLKYKMIPFGIFTTLSLVINAILWMLILHQVFRIKRGIVLSMILFAVFAIINLFFIEGYIKFNYYTFVLGSFLYVVLFIYESFYQLKKENFYFFQSNKYILLFSPILFFLGLSLMFSFKSFSLTSTKIIGEVKLYTFINIFVNVIYYLSLNYYILKEKK